jgi:hypothetical protein
MDRADAFLRLATTLWPERPRLLWEAAVLRAELGDADGTLALAGRFLRASGPRETRRALWLTEMVAPSSAAVVPILAAAVPPGEVRDEVLRRMLVVALSRPDVSLADAAWDALPESARARRELTHAYLEALLLGGATRRAIESWRARHASVRAPTSMVIGGFEHAPTHRGFDWRIPRHAEAKWRRDDTVLREGTHSLYVQFDSQADAAIVHARRIVPVRGGRSYCLVGYWRGASVTTRSGPYLEARIWGGKRLAALPPRHGSWGWEAFRLDFDVPSGSELIEIRLRRDPEGLQRGFSGSIWLDALVLDEAARGLHG